jgi:hypothetical protein
VSDGKGGTNFVVDAHNAQAAAPVVDVLNVAMLALHAGTDYVMA